MPFKFSIPKRLLYITEHGASAYSWNKGELTPEGVFHNGEAPQIAEFEAWLQKNRRIPLFAVIDVIELDFRYEVIPHARGREALALRERKLNASYRATPFRHVLPLGRESSGRRDDRALLSALTNPEAISPWLPVIARNKAPLAGLCATPLLLAESVTQWPNEHTLLVTLGNNGNIRLAYFYQGSLRFSRLASNLPTERNALASQLTEEVVRTQQYLINLRLLGRDDALHIDIVDNAGNIPLWESKLSSTRLLTFHAIPLHEFASRTKLSLPENKLDELTIEELQLQLLARRLFPNHYAPKEYLHEAYLRLLRLVLHGSTVGALVVGSVLAASTVYELIDEYHEINETNEIAEQLNRDYEKIKASYPPAPALPGAMHESVEAAQTLVKLRKPHQEILGELAQAMEVAPAFRVEKIIWAYAPPEESIPQGEQGNPGKPVPPPVAQADINATQPSAWNALIVAVADRAVRPRSALQSVEQMIKRLSENKELTVKVIRYPYNVTPDAQLDGVAGKAVTESKPTLQLQIIWTPTNSTPTTSSGAPR